MNCYYCNKELQNFSNNSKEGETLYLICYDCDRSNLHIKHFYSTISKKIITVSFDCLIGAKGYGVDYDLSREETRIYKLPETYCILTLKNAGLTPKNVFKKLPVYLNFS